MTEDVTLPIPTVTVAPPEPSRGERRTPKQPASQKTAAAALRAARQQNIEADLEAWYNSSMVTAAKMSEDYGLPQSYFVNLMFQAGAKITHSRKPNVYNAWLHHRASEVNDGK